MKKQNFIFLLLSFCFLTAYSQSQQQKTNQDALLYMDSRIQQYPSNTELYLQRAMGHLYIGKYNKAIHDFDTIITMKAGNAEIYFLRGLAKENNKHYQEALSDFDEAVQLSLKKPNAFYFMGRGYAYYKLNIYSQAIKDLGKASSMLPENGEIAQLLKIAESKMARTVTDTTLLSLDSINQNYEINNNALLYFDKLIQQNPQAPELLSERAMAYFFIGRYADAIKDFDKAMRVKTGATGRTGQKTANSPTKVKTISPDWFYFRAIAKESDGLFKEALADLDRAIQITTTKPNYFHFMLRGYARYNLSMYKEAVADLEQANALAPENEEIKTLLTKANTKKAGGVDLVNQTIITELQNYISSHKFSSIAEGKNYNDSLSKIELSAIGFEQVAAPFRKKLFKDVYGDAPTLTQLIEMRDLLQVEKWLLPEGNEQYFSYLDNSSNHFRGEIKPSDINYYFTVVRDSIVNYKYDIKIEKKQDDMTEFAYTTTIFARQSVQNDSINVRIHRSEAVSGVVWRFSPSDYLEVIYNKNSSVVREKAVGKMQEAAVAKPTIEKTKLLEKIDAQEFSNKEAIRKAVQIMLVAYEDIIPKN